MVSQMLINYEELQNRLYRLSLHTTAHTQMVNITPQVQEIVKSSGVTNGLCVIYVPHTTAAITINENTDPDVQTDFMKEINKIVPWEDDYQHAEGNAAAHLKASMMGFSETIIIQNSRLLLGTWQALYFLEYDGSRNRTVYVKLLQG
jgi:secondary thiamine-phosphate synthase enzyme